VRSRLLRCTIYGPGHELEADMFGHSTMVVNKQLQFLLIEFNDETANTCNL
jgi:hypothetical protein